MGYYLGHFYIEKRDLVLFALTSIIGYAYFAHISLPYLQTSDVFLLLVLLLVFKGIVLPVYDVPMYCTFILAIILSHFYPLFFSIVFLFLAFVYLRLFKII